MFFSDKTKRSKKGPKRAKINYKQVLTAARYRGSMIESLLRLSTLRKFSFDKLISQSEYAQKRGYLVSLAMTIFLEIDTEAPRR